MDRDFEPTSNIESNGKLPPLSISELIVLTVAMALTFRFQDRLNDLGMNFKTDVTWFRAAQRVIVAVAIGIPLASTWRFAIQKKAIGKFLIHPGHWILFTNLISLSGFVIPLLLGWFMVASWNEANLWGTSFTEVAMFGDALSAPIAAFIIAFGAVKAPRRWQLLLFTLVGILVMQGTWSLLMLLINFEMLSVRAIDLGFAITDWGTQAFNIVAILAMAIAVFRDLRNREFRDIWHWLGLLTLFVSTAISPILFFIYRRYLFDPSAT
jgi:hypothetical protein